MTPRPSEVNDNSPEISITLDTLDKETPPHKPFSVVVSGTRYVFQDPGDLDWKVVPMAEQNPMLFVSSAVADPKKRNEFIALTIPACKMQRMITSYPDHYGIP